MFRLETSQNDDLMPPTYIIEQNIIFNAKFFFQILTEIVNKCLKNLHFNFQE